MSLAQVQVAMGRTEPASTTDERELIERARYDRAAFSLLYHQHYRMLCAYVFRRTGDVHTTEDLVSDVFLTVLRALPRYRYRGIPVRFWFLRVATNTVNRWVRRQRRQAAGSLPVDGIEAVADSAHSGRGDIDVQSARRALLLLSPKHQAVLALHYLEGLAVKEVAAVIGCREGTVKSRLARARDALREELNRGR